MVLIRIGDKGEGKRANGGDAENGNLEDYLIFEDLALFFY